MKVMGLKWVLNKKMQLNPLDKCDASRLEPVTLCSRFYFSNMIIEIKGIKVVKWRV